MSAVVFRLSRRRLVAATSWLRQSAVGATPRWKHPACPSQSPGFVTCTAALEVQDHRLESSHNDATLNEKGFQLCHSWSSKRSVSASGPVVVTIRGFSSRATAVPSRRSNPRNERGRDSTRTIDATIAARRLLDERRHPLRSFTPELFRTAAGILDVYLADKDSTDVQAINASLELLERVVCELVFFEDDAIKDWFCEPSYFNPLINKWKEAAIRGEKVPSAGDLVKKLQTMSTQLPAFVYNIATISMIMQVEIKLVHPSEAPIVAERLLEFVKTEATRTRNSDLAPNVYLYSQILNAWAGSRLPEAPQRMETIMEDMRSRGVVPSVVLYNTLLRFWGGKVDVEKLESVLETMAHDRVKQNVTTMAQTVYCYANGGQTQKAEEVLDRMIEQREPDSSHDDRSIGESMLEIMNTYRRIVASDASAKAKKEALECAEALGSRIIETDILVIDWCERITNTLMDIYAHDGQLERAEAVFAKTEKPNVFFYTVLIKAYGNCNQADRGAEVLQKLLQDSRVEPTVDVFNSLVEAWAKSSRPDAVEQAFSVLLIMDENAKCLKLGIRPDVVSFNTLLKCIASSKRSDSSKKAEAILDIMDRRYLAGDKLAKPDTISYNIAIKACFQSGDHERAEAVLRRMERSDTPPVVRTYSEILHHFVQVGTPAAAEKADRLLLSMKDLAKTSPSLKPNMFSYTIVLNAWARSGAANATDRMWKIYDQMMTDKIVLGMPCYNVLVSFLSRSRKVNDVTRADLLLQSMENSNRSETRPEGRHYALLLNGWIGVGDAESAARVFERWVAAGTRGVLEEGAKPTPDDFLLVTKVMIRSGDVLKASLFLEKMQKLCEAEKVSVGPDVRAYQALISAWSESSSSVKDTHMTHMQAKIDEFTRR